MALFPAHFYYTLASPMRMVRTQPKLASRVSSFSMLQAVGEGLLLKGE